MLEILSVSLVILGCALYLLAVGVGLIAKSLEARPAPKVVTPVKVVSLPDTPRAAAWWAERGL